MSKKKLTGLIISSVAAVAFLLGMGAPRAEADSVTMYCVTGGSNTCYSNTTGMTDYWTVTTDLATSDNGNGTSDFTFTLDVSYVNGDGNGVAGLVDGFSYQPFSSNVLSLSWGTNPGGWSDPVIGKGQGQCSGNATGSFCGSGTGVAVPTTFVVDGTFTTGDLNSTANFQLNIVNSSGKTLLAISCTPGTDCDGTSTVPEPGSLMLLGTGLLGLGGVIRRKFRI